jgi:hypothetical protein
VWFKLYDVPMTPVIGIVFGGVRQLMGVASESLTIGGPGVANL